MLDKKRPEKIKATVELEKVITEILVANGRTVEPFVKVFNYSGENIVKSPLGSLIGVFEITEQSEDSAYVVNFLASVAKKEYFSNGRRGSIESFEAALHKVNLALAELVRHGNIAWLGKFHGALGVLEKNNLHFSVTGGAEILLLRGEKISEISVGLASPESNIHPIKTFVEISSGHLMLGDKIILTSPELLELLPIEDLEKNALRMDGERFAQFLRTVLINELNMGGSLIVDLKESAVTKPTHTESKRTPVALGNIFSEQTFVPQVETEQSTNPLPESDGLKSEEYIDSKTGHIYVQGDISEKRQEHPAFERTKFLAQDFLHIFSSFLVSQGKFVRKGKKQSVLFFDVLSEQSIIVTRKSARFLRKQWRKGMTASASKITSIRLPQISRKPEEVASSDTTPSSPYREETPKPYPILRNKTADITPPPAEEDNGVIPNFMKEKLAAFYQKNTPTAVPIAVDVPPMEAFREKNAILFSFFRKISQRISSSFQVFLKNISPRVRMIIKRVVLFWKKITVRYQKRTLIISLLSIVVLMTGFFLLMRSFSRSTPAPIVETSQSPVETSAFPLATEKNARLLEESPIIIATVQEPIATSVLLSDEIYLITASSILNTNDNKSYPLPTGNGTIRFASPMDDLRLIFVYTDTNELFSFSPISRTFTKNTLVLPAGALVEGIGTYLTYLYVLDKTTGQIYRFPRAEGGFGAGTTWLKNTLAIEDTAKMAINETIFVAPNKTTVSAFFRGQFVKNLESPATSLSITSLFTHPGLSNVYALDTENKRVLVWNQDGMLLAQYFSEQFANTESITANEKTNEIFLTTSDSLISFKIDLGK